MSTIFSQIINRELPADIVYEDDQCMCFKDIQPQAPIHLILIPKTPLKSMAEVTSEHKNLMGHLMITAQKIAADQGLLQSGFRIISNCGEKWGQTVFHLHFHIMGGS